MSKKKDRLPPERNMRSDRFSTISESRYFVPAVFALILLSMIFMFSDFVFSDKMLKGSDMIQAGIFFRSFLVDQVLETGSVPQWNPYIFGGMPFVEAFHGDLFYPLSFLKYFGDLHRSLGWILFWHIFLAGIFMYLCARQFKLDRMPALFAGIGYMFAPYLVSLIAPGHDGKIFVTALFPLAFLFLERGFEIEGLIKKIFNFTMMGTVIGLIILSPHPQMSYFSLWALGAYTIFKMVLHFKKSGNLLRTALPGTLAVYAVIIGLFLSAIQFYPGYKYTSEFSPRSDTKKGWDWATSWSLHAEEAFSQLIPEFSGVSTAKAKTNYWGKNNFKDNSEAAGVVTIFFALIGFLFVRKKVTYFMLGLAVMALLYALGDSTPFFGIFYYLIPKVESLRAPSMIMFLFSFAMSLSAGFALQWILDNEKLGETKSKRFNYLLWGFPSLTLAIALFFGLLGKKAIDIWANLFYPDLFTTRIQQNYNKIDIAYQNLSAIQTGAWWTFLFITIAALLIWMYRERKITVTVMAMVLLLPILSNGRFNSRFIDTVDPAPHWNSNVVSTFLSSKNDQYRVANYTSAFTQNYLCKFGIQVPVGYHGNQLKWYDNLLGGPGAPNQRNPNFLNLVGTKYFILSVNQQPPPNYFGERPIALAASFGSIAIYENGNALPRVFLVDEYKVETDLDVIKQIVLDGSDDLLRVVYLEKEPGMELSTDSVTSDSVWFINYQPDSVTLGIESKSNHLLVLTDNYFESWHALVDNQPAEILRANSSFRAVAIPAGAKEVKFYFESEKYKTGKLFTYGTTVYILLISLGYFLITRFKKDEELLK